MNTPTASNLDPLACDIETAAQIAGIHKATFRRHFIQTGKVTPRKVGHRTVYFIEEVRQAVSALPNVA